MVVNARSLSKRYGSLWALRDADFTLEKGSVLGLLGPNGAGKSTLIKILTGYHYPSAGDVEIFGKDIYADSDLIRSMVGYLPEKLPFYPELSVKEYLEFVAGSHGFSKKEGQQRLEAVVGQFSLQEVFYKDVHDLSKGYRQRLGLAQASMHQPKLLVLDEPTSGLDPQQVMEFRSYIQHIRQEATVILSSHVLSEVEVLCDQVLVLNQGRLIASGPSQSVRASMQEGSHYEMEVFQGEAGTIEDKLKQLANVHSLELTEKESSLSVSVRFSGLVEGKDLFQWALREGYVLGSLIPHNMSLEDLFLELTQKGDDDANET